MLSFIIGVVLRLVNVMFTFFPALQNITAGFGTALNTIFQYAMQWNWLLPISDGLQLVVRVIQFEFAILLLWGGKWMIELIRGK